MAKFSKNNIFIFQNKMHMRYGRPPDENLCLNKTFINNKNMKQYDKRETK